jgi:hypothetical protein
MTLATTVPDQKLIDTEIIPLKPHQRIARMALLNGAMNQRGTGTF